MPKTISEQAVNEFIAAHDWKQSTHPRYKKAPHSYLLLQRVKAEYLAAFYQVVRYIRAHGFEANFWKKKYTYCKIGEWYYWTMGNPVAETDIINRAKSITPQK